MSLSRLQRKSLTVKAFQTLSLWIRANRVMLTNAASLIGTTGVTSVLGFAYWWLAARRFLPEVVGIGSASIAIMALLGSFCVLGLGTLLITELPRQPEQEGSLISTALILVGVVGMVVGVLFVLIAPYLSTEFLPLRASVTDVIIFGLGVSQTAITIVLDQALIGVLRGSIQLWRNTIFAIGKLILLFMASVWIAHATGMSIYATWTIGGILSLIALVVCLPFNKSWRSRNYLPQWSLLKKLGLSALQHHVLNLALQMPSLLMPVLVTTLLSAKMNAWFYVSWMIVNVVFLVPNALTTVLHAMNSAQPATLAQKARSTIGLAFLASLGANIVLLFGTQQVLSVFGSGYAENAAWSMRFLALAAFPLVIKAHYISICRIQDRVTKAMLSMIPGGVLELVAASVGAYLGGLSGLSLGWTLAIFCEALFMLPTVLKALTTKAMDEPLIEQTFQELEAMWRLETLTQPSMPAIIQVDTSKQVAHLADVATQGYIKKITKEDIANANRGTGTDNRAAYFDDDATLVRIKKITKEDIANANANVETLRLQKPKRVSDLDSEPPRPANYPPVYGETPLPQEPLGQNENTVSTEAKK